MADMRETVRDSGTPLESPCRRGLLYVSMAVVFVGTLASAGAEQAAAQCLDQGVELCDGMDNDCDGSIPIDELDRDGDGISQCEGDCDDWDLWIGAAADGSSDGDQDGFVDSTAGGDDCSDLTPSVGPGVSEVCNDFDDDCDGIVDEEAAGCDAGHMDDAGVCASDAGEGHTMTDAGSGGCSVVGYRDVRGGAMVWVVLFGSWVVRRVWRQKSSCARSRPS